MQGHWKKISPQSLSLHLLLVRCPPPPPKKLHSKESKGFARVVGISHLHTREIILGLIPNLENRAVHAGLSSAIRMTPDTLDLFRAVVGGDLAAVKRALAQGADVNAIDSKGRNVASHAALGDGIEAFDSPVQPRLSERRLEILQVVLEHPDLSLYSLNAPLPWAGGVTLLGLMSWLNMSTEIMFLLEYTQGLVEVNAMDDRGATPLMYAARDGNLEVVRRLLAHDARPDLRDTSQRSAIQYALPHPQILWLCEDALRRERANQSERSSFRGSIVKSDTCSTISQQAPPQRDLFTNYDDILKPPPSSHFESPELRRTYDALLRATRAGDDIALHALLFPAQLDNSRTTSLINLCDNSGLSLVHHAVSQRHYEIGVLDALYRAGADVGLFSTLGFSPLHHLARTARDPSADEHEDHREGHSLYTFTLHLLRELRAPLTATDAKGETPLHAAAEHGNSCFVIQAMLDYDNVSSTQSAREMRNERGLRPVDVCRSEFLSLFMQDLTQKHIPLRPQASLDSIQSRDRVQRPYHNPALPSTGLPSGSRRPSSAGRHLLNKESDSSVHSRSSGSSSTSSNSRPYPSSRKPSTPLHTYTLPTPSPTGTSLSDLADGRSDFDVSEHTHDMLSNLSLCASALNAYSQGQPGNYDADLPDLHSLSEALLFTRDAASLVMEHWTGRLGQARAEFERARKELDKTQKFSEKVKIELGISLEPGGDKNGDGPHGQSTDQVANASVQTEVSAVDVAHQEMVDSLEREVFSYKQQVTKYVKLEKVELEEPATPQRAIAVVRLMQERRSEEMKLRDAEDRVRLNRWFRERAHKGDAIGASLLLGLVTSDSQEVVKEIEINESMVQGEARTSSLEDSISKAPLVLTRTAKDLSGVVGQLAQVTQSFIHAQQSVAEASALIEQALKVREDKLQALIGIPHPPSSFRQPRTSQRPGDASIPPSQMGSSIHQPTTPHSPSNSSSSSHQYRNMASGLISEASEDLRRLLMRKIEKHIEHVFHQLQKAHVWLRIIREVLRGLRRRAVS